MSAPHDQPERMEPVEPPELVECPKCGTLVYPSEIGRCELPGLSVEEFGLRPIGYANDSTVLKLKSGRGGQIHPAQHDGIPPHPVYTADQIREAVEAQANETRQSAWMGHDQEGAAADAYDAGGLAALAALLARMGLEP